MPESQKIVNAEVVSKLFIVSGVILDGELCFGEQLGSFIGLIGLGFGEDKTALPHWL